MSVFFLFSGRAVNKHESRCSKLTNGCQGNFSILRLLLLFFPIAWKKYFDCSITLIRRTLGFHPQSHVKTAFHNTLNITTEKCCSLIVYKEETTKLLPWQWFRFLIAISVKFANFCFEFLKVLLMAWEAISNTWKSVSSGIQTPRKSVSTTAFLGAWISWSTTLSRVWYITSLFRSSSTDSNDNPRFVGVGLRDRHEAFGTLHRTEKTINKQQKQWR